MKDLTGTNGKSWMQFEDWISWVNVHLVILMTILWSHRRMLLFGGDTEIFGGQCQVVDVLSIRREKFFVLCFQLFCTFFIISKKTKIFFETSQPSQSRVCGFDSQASAMYSQASFLLCANVPILKWEQYRLLLSRWGDSVKEVRSLPNTWEGPVKLATVM